MSSARDTGRRDVADPPPRVEAMNAAAVPALGDILGAAACRAIEDASLNASAPPQQRWVDGWLVRTSPGKAKRARCIQPVAAGVRPLGDRLAECEATFREAGLPPLFRITPFAEPAGLDAWLQSRGWHRFDETVVMARMLRVTGVDAEPAEAPSMDQDGGDPPGVGVRAGVVAAWVPPADFARAVGALRGSPATEIEAHAERLALSPVPLCALLWCGVEGVLAAGQYTREHDRVGLYDIHVAASARRRGLGAGLCRALLARAAAEGARLAYLQVDLANAGAQSVYRRLGFAEIYRYHYRARGGGEDDM